MSHSPKRDAANATRSPRAVIEAFLPQTTHLGSVELRPVTMLHYMALEKLGNALVSSGTPAAQDVVEACFIFSLAPEALVKVMGANEADIRQAVRAFASTLPVADLVDATPKVTRHFNAAFATVIPTAPEGQPSPFPDAKAPESGSAGS